MTTNEKKTFTRVIKQKTTIIRMRGRTYRHVELIEEIIKGGETIDLTNYDARAAVATTTTIDLTTDDGPSATAVLIDLTTDDGPSAITIPVTSAVNDVPTPPLSPRWTTSPPYSPSHSINDAPTPPPPPRWTTSVSPPFSPIRQFL